MSTVAPTTMPFQINNERGVVSTAVLVCVCVNVYVAVPMWRGGRAEAFVCCLQTQRQRLNARV